MPDLFELRQQRLEGLLRQGQRVAAGDEHVLDFLMFGDVFQCCLPVFARAFPMLAANQARPGAVAAAHRAEIGGQEEHAVGIAMHQSRGRAAGLLGQRVIRLVFSQEVFLGAGQHRQTQRVPRRGIGQQAQIVGGDSKRKALLALRQSQSLVSSKRHETAKFRLAANTVADLPAPIVPLTVA